MQVLTSCCKAQDKRENKQSWHLWAAEPGICNNTYCHFSLTRSQSHNHITAGEIGKCSLALCIAIKRNRALFLTETGLWYLLGSTMSLFPTLSHFSPHYLTFSHTFALRGRNNLYRLIHCQMTVLVS